MKRRSKYGNVIFKTIDGTFHSKAEYARWHQLKLLQRVGEIHDLERQVKFKLETGGHLIGTYVADFAYFLEEKADRPERFVVEDVKGGKATQTESFKMKAKLMKLIYGVDILITGKNT